MARATLFTTILLGMALLITFFARQSRASSSVITDDCTTKNYEGIQPLVSASMACDALIPGVPGNTCNTITASGTTVFSMSELKHYLCALEVKKQNINEIIVQESAVACTKTIPEYLEEPGCK